VRVARRVAVHEGNSAQMRIGYQTYQRIYPALRSIFSGDAPG
jgi:hypothetical protein